MLFHPIKHGGDVEALVVPQAAIAFDHAHHARAVFFAEKARGVAADIAKPLHHAAFAIKRAGEVRGGDIIGVAEEFAQRILHAAPGRLDPALDAARVQWFAGDAGAGVDVGGVHAGILIDDPGHFTLAGAHVGGGHVLRRVDQVALDQLIGKAAGDLFQLVFVILARVDAQAALGAAEGRLDQRAFVGHQRCQRLDLVLVHRERIADAALDRLHVFGMHRAVAGEGFDLAAQADTEANRIGRVADADFFAQTRRHIHDRGGAVEHEVNGFTKTRLGSLQHGSSPAWLAAAIGPIPCGTARRASLGRKLRHRHCGIDRITRRGDENGARSAQSCAGALRNCGKNPAATPAAGNKPGGNPASFSSW